MRKLCGLSCVAEPAAKAAAQFVVPRCRRFEVLVKQPVIVEPRPVRDLAHATRTQLAAIVVALSLTLGCRASKTQDCEGFVTSVNDVLAAIDHHINAVDGGELTSVEDMRKLAALYQTLGHRIAQMRINSPELKREATAYQTMVNSAANAALQVADALVAEDLEKALAAQNNFTALVTQEDQVVQRINAFCKEH